MWRLVRLYWFNKIIESLKVAHRFFKRINSFLCYLNKTQIMFWLNFWLYFTSKIIVSDFVNIVGKYGKIRKVDHLQVEKKTVLKIDQQYAKFWSISFF